jgi:hypothetical protein
VVRRISRFLATRLHSIGKQTGRATTDTHIGAKRKTFEPMRRHHPMPFVIHTHTGDFTMKPNQVAATLTFAATLLAAGTAFAAGPTNAEYYPFAETTSAVKPVDAGTPVRSAAKSTDRETKTMGAQGHASTNDQSQEILMYLKAGG